MIQQAFGLIAVGVVLFVIGHQLVAATEADKPIVGPWYHSIPSWITWGLFAVMGWALLVVGVALACLGIWGTFPDFFRGLMK